MLSGVESVYKPSKQFIFSSKYVRFINISCTAATWWWIAFRTHAVVKILRNRDKPELTVQFRILIAGLTLQFICLVWYFSFFILARFSKRCADRKGAVWAKHRTPLLAILLSWVLVIVFGLWVELPNIFFPCTSNTSIFCRLLIS